MARSGTLHSLSDDGTFTLRRLRLNRTPLVAHGLRKRLAAEEVRLLSRYRDLVQVLERLRHQQASLLEEQGQLLAEQRALLERLLAGE